MFNCINELKICKNLRKRDLIDVLPFFCFMPANNIVNINWTWEKFPVIRFNFPLRICPLNTFALYI